MQRLICAFFFITLTIHGNTQSKSHNIEFGIDLTGPIILASGGRRPYTEVEFIYREAQERGDLRFKLNINNYNYYAKELILSSLIEDNKPQSLTYFQARYFPRTSYLASIGLSKYLPNNDLPIYTGLDLNAGIGRGTVSIIVVEETLEQEDSQIRSTHNNNFVVLGLTPFIGIKGHLTEKILFGIEFGTSLNFVSGKLEYLNEQDEMNRVPVNRLDLNLNRLINDIVFLIKI
jgi:hypothetical protein